MTQRKLLALDVEGTIITGYDYSTEYPDGRYAAIIDKRLRDLLISFANSGFQIVLATGTSGDNLEYYRKEFTRAGIDKFITEDSPKGHSDKDTKTDKLVKYANQFDISDKNNIYYFDDAENNVKGAKESGFHNSFQVTVQNTLFDQLNKLSDKFGLKKIGQEFKVFSAESVGVKNKPTLLQEQNEGPKGSSPCAIL